MYKIYANGNLIHYGPLFEAGYLVIDPIIKKESLYSQGSFTFTMPPDHPHYDDIAQRTTIVRVLDDTEELFRGRVISAEKDFYNQKEIYCEGELAFLVDSYYRPFGFTGSLADFFAALVENHNSQVDETRQFEVGEVTVAEPDGGASWAAEAAQSTWDILNNELIENYGGYLRVRLENGIRYLDYIADYTSYSSQKIKFGENLLDLSDYVTGEGIITCLIPYGAEYDDEDEGYTEQPENGTYNGNRLTIESVTNDGADYVTSSSGVALYGQVWGTYTWEDVTDPEELMELAQDYVDASIWESTTITITAIDLHLVDVDVSRIHHGDYVRVTSRPHDLSMWLQCTGIEIPLENPEQTKITIGAGNATLTSSVAGGVYNRGTSTVITGNNSEVATLSARLALIESAYITSAEIESLVAESASVKTLSAQVAAIEDAYITTASVETLLASYATIDSLTTVEANITTLLADYATIDSLGVVQADITQLNADIATINNLFADYATITYLQANYALINDLTAATARISTLEANTATIAYLEAYYATIDQLNAVSANITTLKSDVASIRILLAGNESVEVLQAIHLTSDNVVIDDAIITNAMIVSLSADKLTTGTIYTNYVNIQSESGNLYIADNTIQIQDDASVVRVQIGEDASGDYNLYLWDANGVLIWNAYGLTEDGLTGNGAIIKDMAVADDANISGSKLNITSVISSIEADGSLTVDYANVTIDNTTLSAWYATVNTSVSELGSTTSTLQTELTEVQGQITAKVWLTDITDAVDDLGDSITTLQDQYATVTETINGIETEIGDIEYTVTSNYSTLSSQITTISETVDGITTTVSKLESTVDSNYETLSSQITTVEATANGVVTTVSKLENTVDSYYTTLSGKITTLETTVDGFSATIADVQSVVAENIIVDGTFDGYTTFGASYSWYRTSSSHVAVTTYDDKPCVKYSYAGANTVYIRQTVNLPAGTYVVRAKLACGTDCTPIARATFDSNNSIELNASGDLTTEWATYSATITLSSACTYFYLRCYASSTVTTEMYATDIAVYEAIELEEAASQITTISATVDGISATVSNKYDELSSQITQLADSISLSVTGALGSTASIVLTANGSTTTETLDLSNVRSAFASDTTAITIGAGTITFASNTLIIASTQLTLDSSGNATFSGELSAATGTFSGALSAATGTFAGELSAATGTFSGALSAATGTFYGDVTAYSGVTLGGNLSVYKNYIVNGDFIGFASSWSTTNGTGWYRYPVSSTYIYGTTYKGVECACMMGTGTGYYIRQYQSGGLAAGTYIVKARIAAESTSQPYAYVRARIGTSSAGVYGYLCSAGDLTENWQTFYTEITTSTTYNYINIFAYGGTSYPYYITDIEVINVEEISGYIGYLTGSADGETTDGIGVMNSTKENYFIATDAGARITAGETSVALVTDAGITLTSSTTINTNVSITVSSDRALKNHIEALPDAYETLFDRMEPVRYYLNHEQDSRYHLGYIANDVLDAVADAGLTWDDAALISQNRETGLLGLNYTEIIALQHQKIKKLERRIEALERAHSA